MNLLQERIKYLVGYVGWSADSLCKVLTHDQKNNLHTYPNVKKMFETEFNVAEIPPEKIPDYMNKIENWVKQT